MDRIAEELRRWAPPPKRVRYARVGQAGGIPLHRVIIEEVWGALEATEEGLCVRRTAHDVTAEPRLIEDARVAYTADGLVDLGVYGPDGQLSLWDPPQVVLPAEPRDGFTLSATHQRGDSSSERDLQVLTCAEHPDCLVSVAEVRRPNGVLVLRTHFGDGVGFGGYEALVVNPDRPPIRMWTEALTVTPRS